MSEVSSVGLHATVRVRPVTIRFTEPGVADLGLDIQALVSLDSGQTSSSTAHVPALLFDFDAEDTLPIANGKGKARDVDFDSFDFDQVRIELETVLGEETIREIKYRIRHQRPALDRRRLRLIHSGRILRDGIRLVSWLDGLDEHRRLQSKTLQDLAFEASADAHSDSEDESNDDDAAEEKDELRSETTLISSLLEPPDDHQAVQHKGKQKQKQPDWYASNVRVTRRIAPRIYLQCSVGEVLQPGEEDSAVPLPPPPLVPVPGEHEPGAGEEVPASRAVERGFDRLVAAGLSPQEIEEMRSQFRSTLPMLQSGEALRQQEEQEHLLAMEDQWMESFDLPAATSVSLQTIFEGLLAGFFFPPLIPLFFFHEKSHPSSIPDAGSNPAPGPTGQPEEDDQDLYEQEQSDATANIVFSRTMQIAIIFGLVANVVMGAFRWIW